MDINQNNSQANQTSSKARQQGQADQPSGQSSQDNRFASAGQSAAQGQEQGRAQEGGREVSPAGQQAGPLARSGQASVALLPPVDIFEDESGFTLIADLPGVSKEQLGVRVTGDNLVIEGTAAVPATANMELVYGEVPSPQYRRSFTLSRELDPGKIEARLNNGVLTLRIPKAEEAKPRRIEVSVG
jgi:HSP20 family molecular chaperone IbpA